MNAQDDNLRTPLMNAAEKGHHQVIRTLLKAGALVEMRVGFFPLFPQP